MDLPVGHWRNPTYNPKEHPEIWDKYVEFTHNQIMELMENYGRIDILWLDGGQVNPKNNQDVRLSEVVARARKIQPWLITADRTVGGENENYITPEQSVPTSPIRVPWESCVTVGTAFSYRYDEKYKSSRDLVNLLIDVVCRGGNLALNIAPQPNGMLPAEGARSIAGMGKWLKANGEAIYGTRMTAPNEDGAFAFTKKEGVTYALMRLNENETLPEKVLIPWPGEVKKITLLGANAEVSFEKCENGYAASIPYPMIGTNPIAPAFKME